MGEQQAATSAQPRGHTRRARLVTAVAIALSVVIGAACGGSAPKPVAAPPPTIHGTVSIRGSEFVAGGTGECGGIGRFSGTHRGTLVTLTDLDTKAVIQVGLTSGTGTNSIGGKLSECVFGFNIPGVKTASAYTLKIGSIFTQNYRYSDFASYLWKTDIKLGDLGNPAPGPENNIPIL